MAAAHLVSNNFPSPIGRSFYEQGPIHLTSISLANGSSQYNDCKGHVKVQQGQLGPFWKLKVE